MWAENVRPASTPGLAGWTVTGGPTAHAVLQNDNDTSYVSSGMLDMSAPESGLLQLIMGHPDPPPGIDVDTWQWTPIVRARVRWTQAASSPLEPLRQVQLEIPGAAAQLPVPTTVGQWSPWQTYAGAAVPTVNPYGLEMTARAFVPGAWQTPEYQYEVQISQVIGQITAQQQVTVVLDNPPSTVTETTRPTFGLAVTAGTDADLVVTALDVRVYDATGGWSVPGPEVVPYLHERVQAVGGPPTSWTPKTDLPNGQWGVVMRVEGWIGGLQILSVVSSASHHSWLQNATMPTAPVATVTPRPALGRTDLRIVSPTSGTRVRVQYRDDDDGPWEEMRRDRSAPAIVRDGAILYDRGTLPQGRTVTDFEAPIGTERTYRVTAYRLPSGDNGPVVASFPNDYSVTLDGDGTWLHDALDPDRYRAQLKVTARRVSLLARDEVMLPIGMSTALVESQPVVPQWELDTFTLGKDEYWHLYEAMQSGRVFVMRFRGHEYWVRMVDNRAITQESWDGLHMDRQTLKLVSVARPADAP